MIARLSAAYLGLLLLAAVAAPVLAPYGPTETDLDHVLSGPSAAHLLGTDGLGRDVLTRLMYGGRVSLLDASITVLTVLVTGVGSGLVAGYFGGLLDRAFVWIVDVLLAIPVIVTLLAVLAVVGEHQVAVMVALGLLMSPGLARIVRGAVLAERGELYVAAARVSGLSARHIVTRHILPRVAGPITVQLSLLSGGALLVDAGLSYLGFGAQPPTATWGGMIAEGASAIERQPWLLVPPGVVLALAILAFGLLGDALRDQRRAPRAVTPHRTTGTAATSSTLLAVQNVSIAMPGPVTVVEDLTLEIDRGETVGLVGESGCGKTVTGRAILGLVPGGGAVTAGTITFDGNDMTGPDVRSLRGSRIALVSQDPFAALDPVFPVGPQLDELVRRHHGGSRKAARARTLKLLHDVNLPEQIARRYSHELSGGMAQRVGIAMALTGDPDLLIADEPTTALDTDTQGQILALLHRLQQERDLAVLLITHDWAVLADLADRAYVMHRGRAVESGALPDLMENPQHPYTQALLGARLGRRERA